MPLPDHAITLEGGCNCRAIRYRIGIPPRASRPAHPLDNNITLPMVPIDHCNDCRSATGSILPAWITVPADMLSISAQREPSGSFKADFNTRPYLPADEVLRVSSDGSYPAAAEGSTLRFYVSSPNRTRTFCGYCGTNLTYAIFPMIKGFPDIYDTVLGTVDREYLEKDWLRPERHCWWEKGIPWVQEMTGGGPKVPRHPTFRVNERVADATPRNLTGV